MSYVIKVTATPDDRPNPEMSMYSNHNSASRKSNSSIRLSMISQQQEKEKQDLFKQYKKALYSKKGSSMATTIQNINDLYKTKKGDE